jgi:hypothetical protein
MPAGIRTAIGLALASGVFASTPSGGVATAAAAGTPPQITITAPLDGGVYARGASLVADFACTDHDGSSPVIGCAGSVVDGGATRR